MFYFILISSCNRRIFYFEWIYKDFFLFEGNSFSSGWVGTKHFSFYGECILIPVAIIFFILFVFFLLIYSNVFNLFFSFILFISLLLFIYFSIYLLLLSCPGSVQHHLIRIIFVTLWCRIGWECRNLLKYSILEEERKKWKLKKHSRTAVSLWRTMQREKL